jgi:small-conductance mechanosensitive channel
MVWGLLAQVNSNSPAPAGGSNTNALQTMPDTPEEAKHTVLNTLAKLWTSFLEHLPLFFAGLAAIALTWGVATVVQRTVDRLLRRFKLRVSLRELASRLAGVAVWIVGILGALTIMFPSITPAKALATLGLGSIAIGFAFKDIFENFFAGVLILWRFPFEPGDYIQCEGIEGEVKDVTIRNTLIRRTTGELVILPNATVFKSPVHVLTDLPHRRVTVMCGVAYDENVDEARDIIYRAVESCKSVEQSHPIQIFAKEFGESSVNFEVTWWTGAKPVDIRRSRDEVVAAVKAALDEAGIELPYPYRTLVFKNGLAVNGGPNEQNSSEHPSNGQPSGRSQAPPV